jgi:hypothetical protein
VKWLRGPSVGELGNTAQVKVPAGYVFADARDARTIMEVFRNPTTGREMGFVAPAGEDWFAVFEYDDVGYVKDDDKDSLDADALLVSIKEATTEGNKERVRRGWPALTILGWEQPPHYDESTHNLEWAVRLQSDGAPVVNYNTRLLGRGGVMEVRLSLTSAYKNCYKKYAPSCFFDNQPCHIVFGPYRLWVLYHFVCKHHGSHFDEDNHARINFTPGYLAARMPVKFFGRARAWSMAARLV